MSLKIVQEGLTENPLSVPMSASSLNPETQSLIEGGGRGYIGCFFYLHNSCESIVLATSKFKSGWQRKPGKVLKMSTEGGQQNKFILAS